MEIDEKSHRIMLQPITPEFIQSFKGILKLPRGRKRVTEELVEDHRREVEEDDRRFARFGL